ncbi:MAG: type VI secretion system tube protein Hcp [Rubrivivax sp.]|nr:type VI secretion system tube protein Hcp [Rubrivivax sp.]
MAETVHLTLTIDGVAVLGESTQTSLGRTDTIECTSWRQELFAPIDRASLQPTGRRIYVPITFTKRIDRSTPLLREALARNKTCAGTFRFYRPNPVGDGTTESHLSFAFTNGRVIRHILNSPDVLNPDTASLPTTETVEMSFDTLTLTYTTGGVSYTDSVIPST